MMKRIFLVIVCLMVFGCESEPPVPPPSSSVNQAVLVDATGLEVPLLPKPANIVSFAPSITQNIYSLNAGDKLIGVTKYCKIPKGQTKKRIGNLLTQDVEQIVLLKPDLVLASKEGNQSEFAIKLRKMGLRVFIISESKSLDDIHKNLRLLARILGKSKQADTVIENLKPRLAKIPHHIREAKKVFFQLSESLHTINKDTFVGEAISLAGGINIADGAVGRWPMLSIEKIIQEDPDLIIIATMGEITQQAKAYWKKFPDLKAVKNNKVIVVDADICCQPTPENFVKLAEIIKKNLYE